MELARRQVEQHRLASIPAQPGYEIEQPKQDEHRGQSQPRKAAVDLARIYLWLGLVERVARLRQHRQRNRPVHGCLAWPASRHSRQARRTRADSSNAVKALEPSVQAQNMKKPML